MFAFKIMIEVTNTNDYQFEPVHIAWSGLRTQIVIGFLSIFCLCLVNFMPFWQGKFFTTAGSSLIDFTLYFTSCSLVGLITLEIGKVAGSRSGAGSAIWSAMIFAISPWQVIVCTPALRISRMISVLILFSMFLYLYTKKKTNKILAFTILILTLYGSLYFKSHDVIVGDPLKQIEIAAYALTTLILCIRILYGALIWQTAGSIILCLTTAVMCLEMPVSPAITISAGAALAITLSLACLPTVGAASARINRLWGSLGIVVLTLIAIAYEW